MLMTSLRALRDDGGDAASAKMKVMRTPALEKGGDRAPCGDVDGDEVGKPYGKPNHDPRRSPESMKKVPSG